MNNMETEKVSMTEIEIPKLKLKDKVKAWIIASRFFAASANIGPVLFASGLAAYNGLFDPVIFGLAILCSGAIQTAMNWANDYWDKLNGVDKVENMPPERAMFFFTDREMLISALSLLLLAFVTGLYLVYISGIEMLYFGLFGLFLAWFYTAKPINFSYRPFMPALAVILVVGPLIALPTYYVYSGEYNLSLLYTGLMLSLPCYSILMLANMDDIPKDTNTLKNSAAMILGYSKSKVIYFVSIFAGYPLIILAIVLGHLPLGAALVFVTLPINISQLKAVSKMKLGDEHLPYVKKQGMIHGLIAITLFIGLLLPL